MAGCGPLKLDALPEHKLTLALSRGWPATSELLRPYLPHLACLSCIERRRRTAKRRSMSRNQRSGLGNHGTRDFAPSHEPAPIAKCSRESRLCWDSDSELRRQWPRRPPGRFCRGIIGDQARPGWGFKAGHRFPDKPDPRPRLDAPAAAGRSGLGPSPACRLLSFPFQVGGAMSLPSSRTQWPISKVAPGHCEPKGRRRHKRTL